MPGFKCPYCAEVMSETNDTMKKIYPSFDGINPIQWSLEGHFYSSCIELVFYKCPTCEEFTINAMGVGDQVYDVDVLIRPLSLARQFPDYIPSAIRKDYEEANAIVSLSPKSSATLSRRCLQGMIRDFWDIKETNLAKAIEKLEGKIPAQQWKVIDGIRRIGNIGAHMEKDINLIIDIEPDEANKLIKLIEILLEQWYMNRHEQEKLYEDIIAIDDTKQLERKKKD